MCNHRQARNKKKSDKKLGAESLWSMTVLSLLRALSGPNISFLIRGGVHVCNVRLLELVESGQCSCSSHSSQDIGACALEKGWNALILQNLHRAVHRPRVLDRLSRRHHHATTDSVNRIRRDTRWHCICRQQQNTRYFDGNSSREIMFWAYSRFTFMAQFWS